MKKSLKCNKISCNMQPSVYLISKMPKEKTSYETMIFVQKKKKNPRKQNYFLFFILFI